MAQISPEHLDMIVVGTVTSDRQFPSTACMVQKALNVENAMAFDVSAGCSGFLYALTVVNNAIRCGTCKTALVVGVERLSSVINWRDRSTCVLLADGAGAVASCAGALSGGLPRLGDAGAGGGPGVLGAGDRLGRGGAYGPAGPGEHAVRGAGGGGAEGHG